MEVKERMLQMGITQVEMIRELKERGITVQPPMLSSILSEVYTYPKARSILKECEKVLDEREQLV